MKGKMKRLLIVTSVAVALSGLTGCFGVLGTQGAIREWGRYQNGALSTAKMKNDLSTDEYNSTQRETDYNRTMNKSFQQVEQWEK